MTCVVRVGTSIQVNGDYLLELVTATFEPDGAGDPDHPLPPRRVYACHLLSDGGPGSQRIQRCALRRLEKDMKKLRAAGVQVRAEDGELVRAGE